jgi:menaquinone-dependent protoporphyrinogen oxidase
VRSDVAITVERACKGRIRTSPRAESARPRIHGGIRDGILDTSKRKERAMSAPILVTYATEHGSTQEVAAAIASALRREGLETDLLPASEVDDLTGYRGVVLGSAIYIGRLHSDAVGFLRRHERALELLPLAVFAMGPRTLEPSEIRGSRQQLRHALAKFGDIEPDPVAVFGGVIAPETLRFPLNRLHASDARDWDDIDAFAVTCAHAYDYGKAAEALGEHRSGLPKTPR